jgi:acetoacetyl-CoA synthetase
MAIRMEEILWTPSDEVVHRSNMKKYMSWLKQQENFDFQTYEELRRWSVNSIEEFWKSIWQYFGVKYEGEFERVISSHRMPGARWFEGVRINYSDIMLDGLAPEEAILFEREDGIRSSFSAEELRREVKSFSGYLSQAGVASGDRVAAILPNCPEAVVGLLATARLGGIWSSCSAEFGVAGIVDRFRQIEPKVLVAVDGYIYGGKEVDRIDVVEKVREAIPSIKSVVLLPYLKDNVRKDWITWQEAIDKGKGSYSNSSMVPFNHPLWILYSSGTTGLPKPIVHSHGGIIVEHLKTLAFHNDITSSDRFFWYTSTGWMMWNYLIGGLFLGSRIVLYDGSPSYPDMNRLWDLAEKIGITYFGTSAPYISSCAKAGLEPKNTHSLRNLRGIGSTGSPLSAEMFRWVYDKVDEDIWLGSISGGTDVCTAFVGSCPILPVIAGRIQCRYLGASVECYDEEGNSVLDQVGELVITKPMPSMPIYFWNDPDYKKYWESYFNVYPGVWRHGDWIEIKKDGTCIIYGRSDATLKRRGVRIGTAEIYRVVEAIPEVQDSMALDLSAGKDDSVILLFVVMQKGIRLNDDIKIKIKNAISTQLSPRYVPDVIIEAPEIPKTLNGKKMEVPIKRILMGMSKDKVINVGSMANPSSLSFYIEFAKNLDIRQGQR